MSNEEGYFEIYWALRCQKTWNRGRRPDDQQTPPPWWGDGFKDAAKEGWMARASLHVTDAKHEHVWKDIGDRCGPMVTHECDCGLLKSE